MGRFETVDGLLLLNKPAGMTSNQALQRVRRLLKAKKAGHTGSLDPAATGMLPLCFGEATKVCAFLLDADKTYRVTAKLGTATDTGDADGTETASADVPDVNEAEWRDILESFLGESTQIPPMYSALKKDGKRLYELARKGEVVEREPRPIRVDHIELLEVAGSRLVFRVSCSKGTYIRTMVEDIAAKAGTVAHTARLHRETVGSFKAADMLDLGNLDASSHVGADEVRSQLLAPDVALEGMEAIELEESDGAKFLSGQVIFAHDGAENGLVRVYGPAKEFYGVGELSEGGKLAPKRVFKTSEKNS